jgi:hypothetical protein
MFFKKLFLHILLLLSNGLNTSSNPRDSHCPKLPNGCRLERLFMKSYGRDYFLYVCKRIDQSFAFNQDQMNEIVNCTSEIFDLNLRMVYFRLKLFTKLYRCNTISFLKRLRYRSISR